MMKLKQQNSAPNAQSLTGGMPLFKYRYIGLVTPMQFDSSVVVRPSHETLLFLNASFFAEQGAQLARIESYKN